MNFFKEITANAFHRLWNENGAICKKDLLINTKGISRHIRQVHKLKNGKKRKRGKEKKNTYKIC